MHVIQFFIAGQPPTATHQEKQVNTRGRKPRFYEPQAVKEARQWHRHGLAPHKPLERLTGPLRLVTKWCWATDCHPMPSYRDTKPDTDNLIKLLKDEMTATGFWGDDAQVASEVTEKFWAEPAGIYVRVEPLEDVA